MNYLDMLCENDIEKACDGAFRTRSKLFYHTLLHHPNAFVCRSTSKSCLTVGFSYIEHKRHLMCNIQYIWYMAINHEKGSNLIT